MNRGVWYARVLHGAGRQYMVGYALFHAGRKDVGAAICLDAIRVMRKPTAVQTAKSKEAEGG
jgi:hypothetical protein